MANRPCDKAIICPGSDGPLGNFSSEAPDPFSFLSFRYPIVNPNNPIGGDGPRIPQNFFANGCASICVSTISQADADLCAARQAFICSHTPPGGMPPQLFFNTLQTCALACGNGSFFIWQVPPGSFVALNQASADAQAQAYACLQAARFAFCLNDIDPDAETGTPYSSTIFVQSGNPRQPVQFSVIAGSLPPGLHLTPEGPISTLLHGTPTSSGTFTFTILARDALGIIVTKAYTITVTGQICTDFWTSMAAQIIPSCSPPPLGVCGSTFGANTAHLSATSGGTNTGAFFPSGAQGASLVPTQSALHCSVTVTFASLVNPAQVIYVVQIANADTPFITYLDTGFVGAALGATIYNFTVPAGVKVLVTISVLVQDLVPIASFDAFVTLGNS